MTVLSKLLQPVWEISSGPVVISGNEENPDDRRILYVNRAFVQSTGYAREEAIGRPPSFVYGPDTDQEAVRTGEEQLRNGQSREFTVLLYGKSGSSAAYAITSAPLVDVDGQSEYLIAMWQQVPHGGPIARADGTRPSGSVPLTLPMPLHKLQSAVHPHHLTSHAELEALKELWLNVCGNRALPERRDFSLDIMARWAPHLSIALVTPDGRFQFRLFGTRLVEVYGRDLTWCYLDELTPHDLWSVVILHYREVIRTRRPLYAPVSVSNGRWYTEVSRLLLPLSGNGEVNFIMGADYSRENL